MREMKQLGKRRNAKWQCKETPQGVRSRMPVAVVMMMTKRDDK